MSSVFYSYFGDAEKYQITVSGQTSGVRHPGRGSSSFLNETTCDLPVDEIVDDWSSTGTVDRGSCTALVSVHSNDI